MERLDKTASGIYIYSKGINIVQNRGANSTGVLSFKIRDGYPRITYVPDISNYKVDEEIRATFDWTSLIVFVNLMEEMAEKKRDAFEFEHRNVKWEDGKRTDKWVVQAVTRVFRSKNDYYLTIINDTDEYTINLATPPKNMKIRAMDNPNEYMFKTIVSLLKQYIMKYSLNLDTYSKIKKKGD